MDVKQIYDEINSINAQAFGAQRLTVVDNTGIIALGNSILSSTTNTEVFLNTLVQRIGKSIMSYRKYTNMFKSLLIDSFQYGAILQKIKVDMPKAESDESFGLVDGGSVDMWKINKPKAHQKLFVSETPWQLHITIQREHLKEAFISADTMGSFISIVFGEVENAIETGFENLGRNCVNNFFAELDGTTRAINLLALYNTETNAGLTVAKALNNKDFLNWCIGEINDISDKFTAMSSYYNDGTVTRHTPYDRQRLYFNSKFIRKCETVTQYQAFHDKFVSIESDYKVVPYWQSLQTPFDIKIKRASDGAEKTITNIIGAIFDYDALGVYKHDEWSSTTPVNSAGGYTNTYWHFKDMYFNDLSENAVMFYLAEA